MAEGHLIRVIRRKEVLTFAVGAMIGWSWAAPTGGWWIVGVLMTLATSGQAPGS